METLLAGAGMLLCIACMAMMAGMALKGVSRAFRRE
jgi:hypothetical protein